MIHLSLVFRVPRSEFRVRFVQKDPLFLQSGSIHRVDYSCRGWGEPIRGLMSFATTS